MANALYNKGREAFLSGGINWGTGSAGDVIKIAAVTSAYTVNLATHQYYSSVNTNLVSGTTPQTLASKTLTDGIADAADVTFSAVTSGQTITYYVIYKDTGTASTSPLIAYIDTGTNLPQLANGGDIVCSFDNGANKIFKL